MNSAIIKFGEMLTDAQSISTVGDQPPLFSWAAPGDIVIMGEVPEDFNGRVCSVKVPDQETALLCRLYKDGNTIKLNYMDSFDVWKSYPADAVTILHEIRAVVHQYGPMEPPKDESTWGKYIKKAIKVAIEKFKYTDYEQLQRNHKNGRTYDTLAAAFAIGYQAGKTEARGQ